MTGKAHRSTLITIPESGGYTSPPPVPAMSVDRWIRVRIVVAILCQVVLFLMVGLVLWAVGPGILGFHPTVVMSGSMEPALPVGSVAVIMPVAPESIHSDRIIQADDPDHPGRFRLHRVVEITTDGEFITQGDANAARDSSPVPPSSVRGVAVLIVPFVGLPVQAFVSGNDLLGVAWLLIVPLIVVGSTADRRVRAVIRGLK